MNVSVLTIYKENTYSLVYMGGIFMFIKNKCRECLQEMGHHSKTCQECGASYHHVHIKMNRVVLLIGIVAIAVSLSYLVAPKPVKNEFGITDLNPSNIIRLSESSIEEGFEVNDFKVIQEATMTKNQYHQYTVSGVIQNNSGHFLSDVTITLALYDAKGVLIEESYRTNVDFNFVPDGDKMYYKMTGLQGFSSFKLSQIDVKGGNPDDYISEAFEIIEQPFITEVDGVRYIEGAIKNVSDYDIVYPRIGLSYYIDGKYLAGATDAYLDYLEEGAIWRFRINTRRSDITDSEVVMLKIRSFASNRDGYLNSNDYELVTDSSTYNSLMKQYDIAMTIKVNAKYDDVKYTSYINCYNVARDVVGSVKEFYQTADAEGIIHIAEYLVSGDVDTCKVVAIEQR